MKQSFILHIDINSYFASVEQQANPLLRGKPVGVCAYLGKNGCIIASSKEAKKVGIKTGCSIRDAKRLYPAIILVENEPAKYRSTTQKIFKIFSEYSDRIEPYSIDEAFLDMTGYIKNFDEGEVVIKEIQARIKKEVGEWLTSSAGLSWTRFLAKFCSDNAEKDSYLIVDSQSKKEEVFRSIKMTEAWGIKEPTKMRLNRLGIYTLLDLQNYPVANLLRAMGKRGYYLWANANGIEIEGVRIPEEIEPKSIGHTYCIPWKTNNRQYISAIMHKLCEKTGRRLRDKNLEGSVIHAGYSLARGGGYFAQRKLGEAISATADIYSLAMSIIDQAYPEAEVSFLAVSLSGLHPLTGQLSIFSDRRRSNSLSHALDKVNSRYGEYTAFSGAMWGINDQAQDRIGYRKSVDLAGLGESLKYVEE